MGKGGNVTRIAAGVALMLALTWAARGTAQERSYTEVALAAASLERKAVIAGQMHLSEDEGQEFWPIYNEYLTHHEAQNQELASLVQKLAREFETLDDATADELLKDYHEFRKERLELRWKTAQKLRKKLGAKHVARFYQIENKLDTILDMELVKGVPLVKDGP
jgi:hypothetical protein